MTDRLSNADRAKLAAAYHALDAVSSDMRLGLGTGSTASLFVHLLAERRRQDKLKLICVATSSTTAMLAESLGLTIATLDDAEWLDLTVDGADEFDSDLTLIKGGGGALLQEKIVAAASDRMIVIADETKEVERLGAFPLPVEVVRFGWDTTRAMIQEVLEELDVGGRHITTREGPDGPFVTDEGHHILDLHLKRIGDAEEVSDALLDLPGVVETGLFIDMADEIIIGDASGSARHLKSEGDHRRLDLPGDADLDEIYRSIA